MNPMYYLLRRFNLSLMNDKFISALNKSSERYNEIKKNYPQSLDWFKNYVIANLIMSFGRTKELEINDGTYFDIHQYLKKHYSDEIEERWYELQEFDIRESVLRVLKEYMTESDPKVGTGKKPKGSDRRLYTDENPKDTVSVKFRTKQDIVDTLNKESFKSKSHARQSQIINLIHQRLRVALERAKDPDVKKRLKTAFEYIEQKKEQSKRKTQEMSEGDNREIKCECGWSWKLEDGGNDPYTCHKCGKVNTKEELTEKCWPGYTQKGMKTMFGKRYPNCVKKKKK
jgi:hypothetical protein